MAHNRDEVALLLLGLCESSFLPFEYSIESLTSIFFVSEMTYMCRAARENHTNSIHIHLIEFSTETGNRSNC